MARTPAGGQSGYGQIYAAAQAGTLTFRQFIDWWNKTGVWESPSQNVPEIQQLLNVLNRTEPNSPFIKGNQVQIQNGQVAVFLQTTEAFPGQGLISNAAQAAGNAVGNACGSGSIAQFVVGKPLDNFFCALLQKKTWIRVGEFSVGILVVGIALNAALKKQGARKSPISKALKFTPPGRVTQRRTASGRTRYQGQTYATFRE